MFAPPCWVQELVGHAKTLTSDPRDGLTISVTAIPQATFVRIRARDLRNFDSDAFERRTVEAYRLIADVLRGQTASHPVRFWNQIPGIHDSLSSGVDRYMAFNSARFAAFSEWFGAGTALDRAVATATGVGHDGRDVVIDVLAAQSPGRPVQNPRQRPPMRYSRRYGPSPPCFARGTITNGHWSQPRLLIGGTASVRDEESVHAEDLTAQTAETFSNLESLIRVSSAPSGRTDSCREDPRTFAAIESARVYYARADQAALVRGLIERYLPHLPGVEYVRADLCRAELLIEIEGVSRLEPPTGEPGSRHERLEDSQVDSR